MQNPNTRNPYNLILGMLVGVLFIVGLFIIARGIFSILSLVAPLLLVAALIIRYKAVTDFVSFIFKLLKENTILGIVAVVFSVLAYPVLFAYLLIKAVFYRKLDKIQQAHEKRVQGEFVDYEVLEEDTLELESKIPEKETRNEYNNLFND